jgi:hypothetical protein
MRLFPGAITVAVLLAGPSPQQIPLRRIGAPEVELREPFTAVSSIRELSDGRMLVADARDKVLWLVDFASGTGVKVGREGAGPGEYGMPQSLLALPADTTLLYDPIHARLLHILPNGTPGPLFRITEPDLATQGPPRAADHRGRFYYALSRRPVPGAMYAPTRTDIVRFDRAGGRADTLGTLGLPERAFSGARAMPGGMIQGFTNKPLAPQDIAAFGSDGRVAVVRARDYRVEWFGADGRVVQGPPAPYERVRITSAERDAFLASQTRPGSIIVRGPAGGTGSASAGPGTQRAAPIPRGSDPFADQPVEWPDYKPPFLAGAAAIAPDGRLWVLKTRAHDDPVPVYDVFDQSGQVVERVALPVKTRLAGFGRNGLYLARSDEDDLLWLGRYALRTR